MTLSDSAPIGGTTATTAVEGPTFPVESLSNVAPVVARLLRERREVCAQAEILAQANRQLEAFLGIASHELRGSVMSSSLAVHMADRRLDVLRHRSARPVDEQGRDAALAGQLAAVQSVLATAESSLERLSRMVGDLLDVSCITSGPLGQLAVQPAPADLRAIVRAAVSEQRQLAPAQRIRLRLPTGPREVPVWADADRIHQVMTNLLTNALKYTPANCPVDVRVQLRAGTESGWARVCVRDQGPGLPPEEQARIWEAFHRVDGIAVTSGTPHGSAQSLGLGLYICKTIIEQHQGEVGVRSRPGQGATFWFALPLTPSVLSEEDEPPTPARDAA